MLEFFTTTEAGMELLKRAAMADTKTDSGKTFFGTEDAKVFTNMGRASNPPGYLDAGEYDRIVAR